MPPEYEPRLRIREIREQRGWRREKLSTEAGVPYPTLSRIEADNKASLGTLWKLADALDVSIDDLVGRARSNRRRQRGG